MRNCLLLTFLCFFTLLYSQEEKPIEQQYKSYFELPRETIYTHLNKTTFISGEEIWFKAYVYDRHNNLPSKATTNVNVGLYDDKGKLIKNHLWLAVNSGASGNILIDSTLTSGDYYIKASTNWMKNFKESDAFVQKIRIIAEDYNETKPKTIENTYDFQFLPEGGHLVYDVANSLGFKIIDSNGKGVQINGTIYDDSKSEMTTFKSNSFGIGKCMFTPTQGKNYNAEIQLENGNIISHPITDIKYQGITINVNNLNTEKVFVNISTNDKTLKSIGNKTYRLALHKDGFLRSIPFSFETSKTKLFVIPKSDLFKGINILTLFDEQNNTIVERIIYNSKSTHTSKTNFAISKIKTKNDSLYFSIHAVNNKSTVNNQALNNLSISVLPESTLSYDPDHNILSANYLKPYVKGHIEKPIYYFTNVDNKKIYELDVLLLTQGWSRYNWNNIFDNPPQSLYEFENGITLEGKINSDETIKKLRLQDPQLKGFGWSNIDVKDDHTFTVEKFFPIKGETIRISSFDKEGKLIKPNLYVNCRLNSFDDYIAEEDLITNNSILVETPVSNKTNLKNFFYEDDIELDQVLVKTKVKEQKFEDIGLKINGLTGKDNYVTITQSEATRFPTVLDYISANGYRVTRQQQSRGVRIENMVPLTIQANNSPLVFFDGAPITDFDFLLTVPTADIEGIMIDKSGFGSGISGANGVIRIYSRRTPLKGFLENKPRPFAHASIARVGFSESKDFYTPKYSNYRSKLFSHYGAVSWFPNIFLDNNKSQLLKIIDTDTDTLKFYIEGYDSDGNFVSQIKTIDTTSLNN
ncbi:hypothetical protein [uncultured Psychroserpens sp.]|uniref:hypothetical protein n=1 Tax=uncultured Psychroserpens sp. TaxID=255436 RepID=UPI0026361978|nr:hypothetical protein [uncultured Psychroserpens sp.]